MVAGLEAVIAGAVSIATALKNGTDLLRQAKFDSPPLLDAEMLLQSVLGIDRTALYLNCQKMLSPEEAGRYRYLIERRLSGEPVQYLTGWASFYGYKFSVGPGVFVPRFDSEVIVESALKVLAIDGQLFPQENRAPFPSEVIDLCCGCGAIGLSVAAELSQAHVTLIDNEQIPLEFALKNTVQLNLMDRVEIVCRDVLLEFPLEWQGKFDLITANPPYIPVGDIPGLNIEVRENEPYTALTDSSDGLSFYRKWSKNLPAILKPGGRAIIEIGDGAQEQVLGLLSAGFDGLEVLTDVSGTTRAIMGIARD